MIKRNFYRKMLFFYIGIVVLYTSAISVITCYRGFEFSRLQTSHSQQSYAAQSSAYIDYKLQTAFELLYKLTTLDSFLDYQYNETTDYLYITNFYNDLSSFLNGFSRSGITIGVARLTDDIVITQDGTFSHAHYLKEVGISSDTFNAFVDSEPKASTGYTYVVPSSSLVSPNKIMILHKLKGTSKVAPVYFLITLDTTTLLPKQDSPMPGDFSLYTDEPVVCLNNGLGLYNTELLDFAKSYDTPIPVNNIKSGQYIHYLYPSEIIHNLKYIYTGESSSWVSVLIDIAKTSLLPLLILLLLGMWLSCKAVNSTYKPIRALVRFIGDQGESDSAVPLRQDASELDYIQSNIELMYTRNHMLQQNLDLSFIRLQEDFFRKILYGIVDEEFIHDNLRNLKLEDFNRPLRLFLLDCEGTDHISSIISYKNFSVSIYEIISNYLTLSGPVFVLPLDTSKYCVIIYEEEEQVLTGLGNFLIDSLGTQFSLDVMACLSGVWPLADLASGLHEILLLNNYKYTFTDQRVLTSETIKERREPAYHYPLETETCLINYVSSNEHDKGRELLSQLLDRNLNEPPASYADLTHLKYSLITTFKRCLNVDGKSLNQFNREYPTAVEDFQKIVPVQLKEACLALYDIIFDYCNQDKFSLESSTASKIFMYIQENFDKDISLTDIAEHFELSESYISKLLKSSLDVNFKTYVNKLKVKKAKEILSRKDCKINDIAEMVGCNSTNTFIRIFKQYEGVSPGEYMKSLK